MKKEVAIMLAEALESGKYEQARAALRRKHAFCCLGVLCDISKLGEWRDGIYVIGKSMSAIALPEEVCKWAGITWANADGRAEGLNKTLMQLNDVDGKTFKEIAEFIRLHYDKIN